MSLFPEASWPGLVYFAADKFVSLQLRLDAATPGSKEHRVAREEALAFIEEFKTFAAVLLSTIRERDLQQLRDLQKTKGCLEDQRGGKALQELIEQDLTVSELERLMRLHRQMAPPTKNLAVALAALENPWKKRGPSVRGH